GTLHMSLMRSCSAWPSGIWIDGDCRTAPDGSSFAWQHWSHTFEYALAAGAGDWRAAGFSPAAEDYNHEFLTLPAPPPLHPAPPPAAPPPPGRPPRPPPPPPPPRVPPPPPLLPPPRLAASPPVLASPRLAAPQPACWAWNPGSRAF